MLDELILRNGRIHTMDRDGTVVADVAIENGRIAALGNGLQPRGPDAVVVDLSGRTAIPGLIDNHIHFLRMGLLPGHDMRELETTFSVGDALAAIQKRTRSVPDGEMLTALGGIHPNQFCECRFPTLEELSDAAPLHPVYLSVSNTGPGMVNALGRDRLRRLGVAVGSDGSVGQGEPTLAAWQELSSIHSAADIHRQTRHHIAHALGLGLVAVFDMGGSVPAGGLLDPRTGYDPILKLRRTNRLDLRVRLFLPVLDETEALPKLIARLDHTFSEFGDDMLRIAGVGEWLIPARLQRKQPLPAFYAAAVREVAKRGWIYKQHMITLDEQRAHLDVWEAVDRTIGIGTLHWSIDHCYGIDKPAIDRCRNLGIGLSPHGSPYLEGAALANGNPPFREIAESGLPAGSGSDGSRIAPMNPWVMIQYMVSGMNSSDRPVNVDHTVSRKEALRMWTSRQGWFSREGADLGSIEIGKYGDVAVLNQDVFDPAAVPESEIRHTTADITIVSGRVVHDVRTRGQNRSADANQSQGENG